MKETVIFLNLFTSCMGLLKFLDCDSSSRKKKKGKIYIVLSVVSQFNVFSILAGLGVCKIVSPSWFASSTSHKWKKDYRERF